MYNNSLAYERTLGVGFGFGAATTLLLCVVLICVAWTPLSRTNAKRV